MNLTSTHDEIKEILLSRSLVVIYCYEPVLNEKKKKTVSVNVKNMSSGNRKLCVNKGDKAEGNEL